MVSKKKRITFTTDLDSPRYLMALGRFMAQFAFVEWYMNLVVWHYADIDENVGKALLPGMKIDAAMDHLRRLIRSLRLRGREIDELNRIIVHLGAINKVRNFIVHHGAERRRNGPFIATNARVAMKGKIVKYRVGPKVLREMEDDLLDIWMRLNYLIRDVNPRIDLRAHRREAGINQPPAWRYKPPST